MKPRGLPADACACGRASTYTDCCGRWHAGPEHLRAPTAEALMRSRYSAFVHQLGPYLLDTWHPSTRPARLHAFDPALRWLGLTIKAVHELSPDHATVEFVARSKAAGRAQRLHETSRFARLDGRWYYVDGVIR